MGRVFVMIILAALSCGCTDRASGQPSARATSPAPAAKETPAPLAPQAPTPPAPPREDPPPPEFPPQAETPSPPETEADRECQRNIECTWTGRCHSRDGKCVALTDRDCEASEWCSLDGSCSVTEDQRCVALVEDDCARLCHHQGRCTIEGPICVARSSADCEGPCALSGRCELFESESIGGLGRGDESRSDGECVVWTNTDCSKTRACREEGLCELAVERRHHGRVVEYTCAKERSPENMYRNFDRRRRRAAPR